ncbi:MAG: DEAD/DEAH box helicase, partial [Bifidobacteriaceae bacterium]|nr:DEAD/DEAH box helicase [Bifidobacteriaceae bacterium]
MRVIHAFWSPKTGLNLWAEDSDRRVKSGSQAYRSARPHPFAVPAEDLAADLVAMAEAQGAPEPVTGSATVLLPSLKTAPLDSPELIRRRPRPPLQTAPVLAPWAVPVVSFAPDEASDTLGRPLTEARAGQSLEHLREVAAFAEDLAERRRTVPVVEACADHLGPNPVFRARWAPVVQGPDLAAFQSLVAAMPPVGRAQAGSPSDTRGQSPSSLVTSAVEELIDAAVRDRLGHGQVDLLRPLGRPRGRRTPLQRATDAWLEALTGQSGRFVADEAEIGALARSLAPWDDLLETATSPARLLLRVVEPTRLVAEVVTDEHGDIDGADQDAAEELPVAEGPVIIATTPWRIEFLLQSAEDPSLQIPATHLWQGQQALSRWLDRPDELLLTELGKASTIYPELARALHQARPAELELDDAALVAFLSESAPLLEQAGFAVLVPSWWTARATLGLQGWASPAVEEGGASRFSKESICQFDWRLALGDDPLTAEELALLAEAKTPLVRMRGEWVAFDPDRLARALAFIEAEGKSELSAAEVIGLAAAHPDDLELPLPVTGIGGEGTLGALLSGSAEDAVEPVSPPDWFAAELRPYQQRGLAWLAFLSRLSLGACLADDMGLGKTVQLLALEAAERDPAASDTPTGDDRPTLILCPMSLVGNWQREAARFAPDLRVYAHHGPARPHGEQLAAALTGVDIVLTTYQTAVRDSGDLTELEWRRVVLDEAQAIKNSNSQAAKTARRLRGGTRVALTGTPMENRLVELRSIMDFLNPGILGSAERFRERFAYPIERHSDPDAAKALRAVTRPYILRRVKTDKSVIDDLPDKIELREPCTLTAEQASLYQAVVDDVMEKIDRATGMERRANVLAAMTKLKQICNHPAQFLHQGSTAARRSGKVTRLMEILDEIIAEGDKALLFTQFTQFGGLLLEEIALRFGFEPLFLHGSVPRSRREEMVASFQSGDGPPLFLLSLKAGGTGLNLTAANHVIHVDRW